MSEPTLFRVGSACLIVGSLLAIVVNALHPRTTDIANPQALVQLAAASDLWVADHLGILLATAWPSPRATSTRPGRAGSP